MARLINVYNRGLDSGVEIDSLVLTMAVDTIYGDATPQTIRVYEVTQDLISDSVYYLTDTTYYSDQDPTPYYNPVETRQCHLSPGHRHGHQDPYHRSGLSE